MARNLVEELRWRGLLHDMTPGTEEKLQNGMTTAYIGFDPTADALHVGSLVPVMLLVHLFRYGHKPVALLGGATGMIGDPSGKSDERNLLDEATLQRNVNGIKSILEKYLDFKSTAANAPLLVNNYDWMKSFTFIEFAREVGKRITVNYMMSKDSVKKRLQGDSGTGMSFTEFTYQLIQGYDFYHLHKHYGCELQMGGSDQWGNITTGMELVRRMNPDQDTSAFALTCPLITKSDGSKFGKSESGNVWLTPERTSVFKFYQFWLNVSDEDAEKYIKIFTFLDKLTVDQLISAHREAPHLRGLQKRLAQEVTNFVHGEDSASQAEQASDILFSKNFKTDIQGLDESTFNEVFEGVPMVNLPMSELTNGMDMIGALSAKTQFLPSNGEARRALQEQSISVNKEKVGLDYKLSSSDLIHNAYVVINKGKRQTFIIKFE